MRRVALFNSRKPRRPTPGDRWVRLTTLLARHLAASGDVLVTGLGPLHYDLALHCALAAGGPAEVVGLTAAGARAAAGRYRGLLDAPRLRLLPAGPEPPTPTERDRAVAEAADEVLVVEARAGGAVERLAWEALLRGRPVLVCPADDTAGTAGNRRLLAAGAEELWSEGLGAEAAAFRAACAVRRTAVPAPTFPVPPAGTAAGDWPWVVHFTRACAGEFPGETRAEHLAALAGADDPRFHDARRALERILGEGRIRSAGRLIRGGHAVVSFTAAHPHDLARLARWARHLGRMTFEPYGVGVRRAAATRLGLRPAVYGPPGLQAALPEGERYLFQVRRGRRDEWAPEREWRARGDVELRRWPADEVVVVVPTRVEAAELRSVTSFPVLALEAWPAQLPADSSAGGVVGSASAGGSSGAGTGVWAAGARGGSP
ncbi:MAG: hypothetical protein JXB32_22725 [Deltaproteobacteria bacterium]|nr:hypothetical protein [Deltaproteobacteria bacterium]